jgi:hypothetical protein
MKRTISLSLTLSLLLPHLAHAKAPDNSGKSVYARQLLGLTNGVIGSAVITKCKTFWKSPSTIGYMGASLVYLGRELTGASALSQGMDAGFNSIGEDLQREVLQVQIDHKQRELKQVNNRKKWTAAIAAAYAASSGLAVAEQLAIIGMDPSCASNHTHRKLVRTLATAYNMTAASTGGSGLVGAGAAIAAPLASRALEPILLASSEATDKGIFALNAGAGRAIWFGATAAVTGVIAMDLNGVENKIKKQISDLEKTRDSLSSDSNGLAEDTSGDDTKLGAAARAKRLDKQHALKELPKGLAEKKYCLSNNQGAMDFSSEACSNPTKLQHPKFDSSFNLPTLQTAVQSTIDMANAMASGNTEGAEIEVSKLAAMAGRIKEVNENLQKKLNEKLIAEGKKPIDFEGDIKKQIAAMEASVADAMAAQEVPSLASDSAQIQPVEAAADNTPKVAEVGGGAAPPISEEGIKEGAFTDTETEATPATLEDKLSEFEAAEQDISKTPDVSIFQQLSHRYFLNYSRFFVEKKRAELPESPTQ